jgi:structural maintenance of chromosome 2
LCVLAWALIVANAGVTYAFIVVRHIGFHIWEVPHRSIEDQVFSLKLSMAQQLLYTLILCLVKASTLLFFLRLGDQRRVIRYSLKALFVFNFGQMVAVFVSALTQCRPIHMFWDHPRTDRNTDGGILNSDYTCFNAEAFAMVNGGLGILTDILILMIPIAMVWPLRLNWRKKLAVGCILSLGWIVVAVAIVRLKSFHDLFNVVNPDPTYALGVTTSSVELNVALTVCCGPAINSIITRFAPRIFATRNISRQTADLAGDPYDHEIPARQPKRYLIPSISTSRYSERPYRVMDEEEVGPFQPMDYASLEARRAEIIRAMINNDKNGRGVYVR